MPSVWKWSCHYLFLRIRYVSTGDQTSISHMRGKHWTAKPPRRTWSATSPWVFINVIKFELIIIQLRKSVMSIAKVIIFNRFNSWLIQRKRSGRRTNRGVASPKWCVRKSERGSLVTFFRLEEAALRQKLWGKRCKILRSRHYDDQKPNSSF